LAFAFFYAIVLANLVRSHASTRTNRTSDKCALPAANQTAHYSSTSCGSADNLRRIVMTFVMSILLPLRFPMLLGGLRKKSHGKGQNSCKRYETCN
jgi:hypothetical protein